MARYIKSIDQLDTIHLLGVALVPALIRPAQSYLESLLLFDLDRDTIVNRLLDDLNETIGLCQLISNSKPLSPDIPKLRPYHEEIRAKVFVLNQYLLDYNRRARKLPSEQKSLFLGEKSRSKVKLFVDS